jgi:hypothetical protein
MSGLTPADSRIKVTRSIEDRVAAAGSQAEIQQIMRQAAIDQGAVVPDIYDPNVLLEVVPGERSAAPQKFGKTVTVNGTKHVLSANSEAELLASENALFRGLFSQTAPARTEPVRNDRGQFVKANDATAKAAEAAEAERLAGLQLDFQIGRIDAATYIRESHAVDSYLAEQGVDMDALKEVTAQKQGDRYQQSWKDATEAFKQSADGADWPGGNENLKTVGELLIANGFEDAEDKVAALQSVYQYMRDNKLVREPVESKIANAQSPEQIREALGRSSSSLFGGR